MENTMRMIDLHCDTLLNCYRDGQCELLDNPGHISLRKMKEGGALAQFFAIYISRNEMKTMDPYEIFQEVYKVYQIELEKNKDLILPAYCAADIQKNIELNKMSALLSIEDGVVLSDQMERVEEFYQKGVRLLTLTWNFENTIGFPCSKDEKAHQMGLKPFGIHVVEEMNRLGMLIDVSHLSEGGFYDVAKYSKKPFVASHSCARALCNHQRNLTDEQLKTLGEKGGVVGVNFCASFLKEGASRSMIDDIVAHTVYMADKAGVESIGFGSDFDGIDDELEMKDYSGYLMLLNALSKHFKAVELDKICNGNAMRIIKDCL
ncbi:dipeptidase [Sinanaerobacter sp. ZZT-01]|uniref:dipeptidase n=1 Tax=Sinanaerobacter sp. ZZT-01 TaxID=3111540 RepID=UPI002D77B438|nr:dipeptidase [Sinanaerobacter sp. ZZT-01]WRR94853.1 dipeptidase [Sinanaerobacter sp. ZZT-01]